MIEVRIPKEIKEYKEKLFFGLTLRQCICTALALSISVPFYIFSKGYLHEEIRSWGVIIVALPLMLIGFFTYNQMTFEQFFIELIKMYVNPQKRPFKQENIYQVIRKEIINNENAKCNRKGQGKVKKGKGKKEIKKNKDQSSTNSTADNSV